MKKNVLIICTFFLLMACKHQEGTIIRMETSEGNIRLKLYDETVLHRDNMLKLIKEGFYEGVLFHRVIKDFMIQAGDPDSKNAAPGVLLGEKDGGYTVKSEILPRFFHKRGVLAAAREGNEVNPERASSSSHFYIVVGKVFTPQALDEVVSKINDRRYKILYDHIKDGKEEEINKCRQTGDEKELERIQQALTDSARILFEKEKLLLTDEQRQAYTTVGGTPHLDGEYTIFGEVIEGMDIVERISVKETDDNDRPRQDVIIQKVILE